MAPPHPRPARLVETSHLQSTILQIALSPLMACSAILPLSRGRRLDEPVLVWAGWAIVVLALLLLGSGMWTLQRALRLCLSIGTAGDGADPSSPAD